MAKLCGHCGWVSGEHAPDCPFYPTVAVTPESVREVLIVQADGRLTVGRLEGPVRFANGERLVYRVKESS